MTVKMGPRFGAEPQGEEPEDWVCGFGCQNLNLLYISRKKMTVKDGI